MADPAAYFAQCLAWLAGALALPVLSAVVHRDEPATHLHVLLLPVKGMARIGALLSTAQHSSVCVKGSLQKWLGLLA